jgi:hypothetical protein
MLLLQTVTAVYMGAPEAEMTNFRPLQFLGLMMRLIHLLVTVGLSWSLIGLIMLHLSEAATLHFRCILFVS